MKTFALFVAPWDLAERSTRELFRWASDQGINTIYLTSVYHAGWFLHSHHRRKAYMVDDGTCYFHPDLNRYDRTQLKPKVASLAAEKDWIEEACEEAHNLGMKILLWTVCLHNSRLGLLHPDATCRNAYGDSYPHALCPSHPGVREYVTALIADQMRYHPDGFFLEATGYRGRTHGHHHERDGLPMPALEQHLLNLSFAPSDCRAAETAGIDVRSLREQVRGRLDAFFASAPRRPPGKARTLEEFRHGCPTLRRYEEVLDQQVDRLLTDALAPDEMRGLTIIGDSARPGVNSIFVGCYNQPEEVIATTVASAKQDVGNDIKLIAGLRLGFNPPPATPAINSEAQACGIAQALTRSGVQGMAFYFYGEAPATTLAWIGPMIRTATGSMSPQPAQRDVERLRVALIGAGAIGAVHGSAMRDMPGVDLRSVFDVNHAKATQLAATLGFERIADSVNEIIDDDRVDMVIVASTPDTHAAMARSVLEARKHLLLEKPLGLNLADADAIVDCAASRPSQVVGVALVHRYDGNRLAARDLIASGAIGRLRQVRYRWGVNMYNDPRFVPNSATDRRWLVDPAIAGGGLLPSSSIHTLSVISFLLGDARFESVSGSVRRLHPRAFDGIEDDVTLLLRVADHDGLEVVFEESWAVDLAYEITIVGEAGHLRLSGPQFTDVSLTGVCQGDRDEIPERLRHLFEGDRLVSRPHELDDHIPPFFRGLAADMAAACRGNSAVQLPNVVHARNLRAVIVAAYQATHIKQHLNVDWRTPSTARQPSLAQR